ncbi:MAG: FAD-binding oxidoreductase [Halobacteriota archaeon]|nr:FAD-binding oxidoreductase [Halobacteriota archaeon]
MVGVYNSLCEIVGKEFTSNKQEETYIYSRDLGAMERRRVDYVVMPKKVEEVQMIVKLANEEKIPIVPMGGGVTTSGLTMPVKGGIVMDLKRMDKIIGVNEKSRYVIIEPGVTQGQLRSYLEENHPLLRHSMPDAPPIATVTANALVHGSGHLSQRYGFHSDMINGMEVVLPTGEMIKVGSCSVSSFWFSRAPLPDLAGLFIGWYGTTGIVTKLSLRLYPREEKKDLMAFMTKNPDLIPGIWYNITQLEVAEDVASMYYPAMFKDLIFGYVCVTGNSDEEITFKKKSIQETFQKYNSRDDFRFTKVVPLKKLFLKTPLVPITQFADDRKGGGFEYVGPIMPIEKYPEAHRLGLEIASKYDLHFSSMVRVIGRSHSMMFGFAYPFNRANPNEVKRVGEAIQKTNEAVIEMGGVPWKADIYGQRMIVDEMDKNTLNLIKKIRKVLDPNGIMNPGNLEVE